MLKVSGELDMATAEELRRAVDQCPSTEPLTIDTTELEFIDSSGLALLVTCRQHWGDSFTLIAGPAIERLLDLTDTRQHFGL